MEQSLQLVKKLLLWNPRVTAVFKINRNWSLHEPEDFSPNTIF